MERILIAEDEPICRQILEALLKAEYAVTACADGDQVIAALKAEPEAFKCLVLDMRMPNTDGFGVLDFMRTNGYLERIPVIALTVFNEKENQLKCYQAGVCDLVEKPYNKEILRIKIRNVIERANNGTKV